MALEAPDEMEDAAEEAALEAPLAAEDALLDTSDAADEALEEADPAAEEAAEEAEEAPEAVDSGRKVSRGFGAEGWGSERGVPAVVAPAPVAEDAPDAAEVAAAAPKVETMVEERVLREFESASNV